MTPFLSTNKKKELSQSTVRKNFGKERVKGAINKVSKPSENPNKDICG